MEAPVVGKATGTTIQKATKTGKGKPITAGNKPKTTTTTSTKKKKKVSSTGNSQQGVVSKPVPKTRKGKNVKLKKLKKKPVVKQEALVECVDPLKAIKSPYGGMISPNEQFTRFQNGLTGARVQIENDAQVETVEDLIQQQHVESVSTTADNKQKIIFKSQTDPGVHLIMKSLNLKQLDLAKNLLIGSIISLDLGNNCMENESLKVAPGGQCFIRQLSLQGNKLTKLPSCLNSLPCLVTLDLSYNNLEAITGHSFATVTPNLRSLSIDGCHLTRIKELVKGLQCLSRLSISYNKLDDMEDLKSIALITTLTWICLEQNPIPSNATESLFEYFRSKLARLKVANNSKVTTILVENDHHLITEHASRAVNGELACDNASCSCLEGNPCAVSYNCKDWVNRFEVAKAVRNEKYDMVF